MTDYVLGKKYFSEKNFLTKSSPDESLDHKTAEHAWPTTKNAFLN